jgi:hypothetical protein
MLDLAGPPLILQPHPAHPPHQKITKHTKKLDTSPLPVLFFRWGGPEKRGVSGPPYSVIGFTYL